MQNTSIIFRWLIVHATYGYKMLERIAATFIYKT